MRPKTRDPQALAPWSDSIVLSMIPRLAILRTMKLVHPKRRIGERHAERRE